MRKRWLVWGILGVIGLAIIGSLFAEESDEQTIDVGTTARQEAKPTPTVAAPTATPDGSGMIALVRSAITETRPGFSPSRLTTKDNPKGDGVFVYDPPASRGPWRGAVRLADKDKYQPILGD
jgi:hypothetical protein